jgi:hypothetical protein
VGEIEERRQFLEEMEALGRGKEYRTRIATEISQVRRMGNVRQLVTLSFVLFDYRNSEN